MANRYTITEITRLITTSVPYLTTEAARLPLATGKLDALTALKTRYDALKIQHDDPGQRTVLVSSGFRAILKEAETDFRDNATVSQNYPKGGFDF